METNTPFRNKYAGECHTCKTHVPKNEGIYDWGKVYCTEPRTTFIPRLNNHWTICLNFYNKEFNTNFTSVTEIDEHAAQQKTEQEQTRVKAQEEMRQNMITNQTIEQLAQTARVRSLTQVINKVLGTNTAITDMTFTQLCEIRDELQKRIDRKTRQADPNCTKCHGTGAYWKMGANNKYFDDGCWKCHGTGKKLSHL